MSFPTTKEPLVKNLAPVVNGIEGDTSEVVGQLDVFTTSPVIKARSGYPTNLPTLGSWEPSPDCIEIS